MVLRPRVDTCATMTSSHSRRSGAAAIIAFFGYEQTHETYGVLFSQLDQDDAAAIVEASAKTPTRAASTWMPARRAAAWLAPMA